MDWFSFCLDRFTITFQGILLFLFTVRFTKKKIEIIHFVFFVILLHTIVITTTKFNLHWLDTMLELLVLYCMNRLALKNSRSVSCVTTFLAVYITRFSIGIVNPLETLLFPSILGNKLILYLFIIWATIFAFVICLCCYRLILKRFPLQIDYCEPCIWLLFPFCLFFFAVQLYILQSVYGIVSIQFYPVEIGKHITLLILQALGLCALFSALYAYQRTCDNFHTQATLDLLKQETQAQKIYVSEAQIRYERTKALRHDLKNHLFVLNGFLNNGDLVQAQNYLQKLDIATGELSFPAHTNNPVVDILLSNKLEIAKLQGIEIVLSVSLPQPCIVDDLDLCIIFANALDNAIHACKQEPKLISITGIQQGDFYMLEFENTCSSNLTYVIMGTGLSNIKTVAEKYGGTICIEKNSTLFRLNILLNISLHLNNHSIHNT